MAVFSLLAATGLRLSEVCRLEPNDVILTEGILTVRDSKFRKSRLVLVHPTTSAGLRSYVADHSRLGPDRSGGFFRTDHAVTLKPNTVERTFARIRQRLGWTADGRARRPRIHLRHSVAVRRLLAWHEEAVDSDRKVLALSTYLGQARPSDTYWYFTAVPELLMAVTSRRFEDFAQASQEADHDCCPCQFSGVAAGLLPATADRRARCQRPHHRQLPRHLRTAA